MIKNPERQVGGILFYDEQTNALVQVLEGPAFAVRSLFYQRIMRDRRHTNVRRLLDIEVSMRRYDGFGMKLGACLEVEEPSLLIGHESRHAK